MYDGDNIIFIPMNNLIKSVETIARTTGEMIRSHITNRSEFGIETKGLNDFVTEIDKKSELYIVTELEKLIPDAGFIAEENTSSKIGKEFTWIIDPLDGTTNFIHGFYPCSVSIGLKQNDEIVLGVVYEIGLDECFCAWKGGGAWLNGKRIKVSETKTIKSSLLGTGFPYHDFDRLQKYMKMLQELMMNSHGIRRPGSAAADMAYVACGRFDAFFEYDLKPYDVAAGIILVKEAGGKICDFSGGENYLFGKEIIAANSFVFDELADVVKKYMVN